MSRAKRKSNNLRVVDYMAQRNVGFGKTTSRQRKRMRHKSKGAWRK